MVKRDKNGMCSLSLISIFLHAKFFFSRVKRVSDDIYVINNKVLLKYVFMYVRVCVYVCVRFREDVCLMDK